MDIWISLVSQEYLHEQNLTILISSYQPQDVNCWVLASPIDLQFVVALTKSFVNFVGGRPALRLSIHGLHARSFLPQWSCVFCAIWLVYCYFKKLIHVETLHDHSQFSEILCSIPLLVQEHGIMVINDAYYIFFPLLKKEIAMRTETRYIL